MPNYETKYGYYSTLFDEAITEYKLNFNPDRISNIDNDLFYKWFFENDKNFNRIIVALGDDAVNIEIANKLVRYLQIAGKTIADCRNLVFVHIRQSDKYDYYKNNDESPITIFGNLQDIYTEDIVIRETDDKIAKAVNYVYNKSDKPVIKEIIEEDRILTDEDGKEQIDKGSITLWREATIFNKNSSRAVAQNIENIMKIIGKQDFSAIIADIDKLNILAENEHLRWNAFLLMNGIRLWKLDEITKDNAKLRDENRNLLKHGCLVPFEKLEDVTAKVKSLGNANEDYVETDRRIVSYFQLFNEIKNQSK